MESDDPSENDALLSAAEQGQSTHGRFQYFNTFVHAALIVYELGLLDLVSVKYVSPVARSLCTSWACWILSPLDM